MNLVDNKRFVAHLDLDTFFVSVERLKNSKFIGKPLIVGGMSDRAVVSACSYETRKFGVHSAMPMKLALRLCPHAIVVRGDMDSYSYYSRVVTDVVRETVPVMEKASVDEFYVDLTGVDRFFGCSQFMVDLKGKIQKESGLPISYALASNKLISKVATDDAKPDGRKEILHGLEKDYLAPLKIQRMPGIGDKTSMLLLQMGVKTIKILSEIPVPMMHNLLGKNGIDLSRKANGIDPSPIIPYSEQKSIGTEETFVQDTINMQFLNSELIRMTERLTFQLRRQERLTGCVTVKLRYANFDTVSKQMVISYTASDTVLLKKVKELFAKLYDRRMLVRLIGVRFSHLVQGSQQINLFEDTEEAVRLYQAMDAMRARYGDEAIKRAISLKEINKKDRSPHF
ncbi:DNA polymerase IV [Sphingobacterium mizutaii NBRC 14946 = DSM 11724]|uniref:DNA polymerase IV n=2 Tax=Sphingobacterium mizutaii TaxID=1010 RepID=A0AAJ4X9L4_9SPHI|nr:DNA polymerase IV [Sphingobacterium mizutaii]GEM67529.1 DNA polymerase IV [Sphingobacterium mizutaii NBRC 14946 = DSM 11724]SDL40560.1 DNA polymerase-4 [Sphingobacterium mizutaii]SNV44445.1 DNA polymerase IV [Sphingobacterium mizutaii]